MLVLLNHLIIVTSCPYSSSENNYGDDDDDKIFTTNRVTYFAFVLSYTFNESAHSVFLFFSHDNVRCHLFLFFFHMYNGIFFFVHFSFCFQIIVILLFFLDPHRHGFCLLVVFFCLRINCRDQYSLLKNTSFFLFFFVTHVLY